MNNRDFIEEIDKVRKDIGLAGFYGHPEHFIVSRSSLREIESLMMKMKKEIDFKN